jgi:hypothetical protein
MPEVIRPSFPPLYWREIFSTGSAYDEAGILVLKAIPLSEASRPKAKKQFLEGVGGARSRIASLQNAINAVLLEPTLADSNRTAFAIKASLDSFADTPTNQPATSALKNAETLANLVEQGLIGHLQLAETPIDYYHVANSLYFFAVSLHLGVLFLADQTRKDNNARLCGHIGRSFANRSRAVEVARLVGAKRVSDVDEELTLIDELGPVWGTNFTIRVDGRVVYNDTFAGSRGIPRRTINEVRAQAKAMRDSLVKSNGDAVSAEVTQAYDLVDGTGRVVCRP